MFEQQSTIVDQAARKRLVNEIDRKVQLDTVRPTITFAALPYCRRPYVKGYVPSRFLAATHARSRAFAGRQGRKNRAIAQAIQLFLCEAI